MVLRKRLVWGICFIVLCGFSFSNKTSPGLQFIKFLNQFDKAQLDSAISTDFVIRRNFAPVTTNREEFLGEYQDRSKILNAKFIIKKTIQAGAPEKYLVEDKSDYFDLLKITRPTWVLTLTSNEDRKISSMLIDTTETYPVFKQESEKREADFSNWMKTNYPDESTNFMEAPEHFMKRLREYSKSTN